MNLQSASVRRLISSIEALEARIAPAALGASVTEVTLVSKHVATFTDADGDLVKIEVSKGTLDQSDFVLVAAGTGADLRKINFSDDAGEFAGANLTITAKRGTFSGNGFANVGFIESTGADLGKVSIKGDLGRINAGLPGSGKLSVKSLTVQSMGALGLATQDAGGSLASEFAGSTGAILVKSDLDGVTLAAGGGIESVKVRGSMNGGQISAGTTLGDVSIRGDINGTAAAPARITALGNRNATPATIDLAIANLKVGGSVEFLRVLAGANRAGVVSNEDASIGKITVGGDWHASTVLTGSIAGDDGFEGTVDDGTANNTQRIYARIAAITIGGQAYGTLTVGDSFGIIAEEIGKVKIGGIRLKLESGPQSPGDFFPLGATVPGPNGLPSDFSIGEIVPL